MILDTGSNNCKRSCKIYSPATTSPEIYIRSSVRIINPCIMKTPRRESFANSEDPDEMQHNAAFHLGLHYF